MYLELSFFARVLRTIKRPLPPAFSKINQIALVCSNGCISGGGSQQPLSALTCRAAEIKVVSIVPLSLTTGACAFSLSAVHDADADAACFAMKTFISPWTPRGCSARTAPPCIAFAAAAVAAFFFPATPAACRTACPRLCRKEKKRGMTVGRGE
jgi:hypothetical protein